MSIESTMAILYAQTGLAAPIVNAATVGPQAAAAMSRTLAAEMAKQEQQQVNKAEPQAEGAKVSPDAQHQNGGQMFGNRRKRRLFQPAPEEDDGPRPSGSPLVGNLLNIKI